MPSLKDLKNRIYSVKSTRKITSAMKMVAASKLRKAQDHAEAARPYAGRMAGVVSDLMQQVDLTKLSLPLLQGNGKDQTVLLVLMTSDRGLCGAFNSSIVREARHRVRDLEAQGKTVKLICVGRKARDMLRREYGDKFLHTVESGAKKNIDFADAQDLANRIVGFFEDGSFDVGYVIYNKFRSAISQIVTAQQIVPFVPPHVEKTPEPAKGPQALHELYEPAKEALLTEILPRNLATALFSALLESSAGEQGARMTAMDNATRNAGDMIDRLTLNYNRSRQAYITNELIEIISGAEAV